MLDIDRVFYGGEVEGDSPGQISGEYPSILHIIALLIGHAGTEVRLPAEIPHEKSRLGVRTEIEIADLVKEEKNPSGYEDKDKKGDSIAFAHA